MPPIAKRRERLPRTKWEKLRCGCDRDGRPEIAYVSCGHITCDVHTGPHDCALAKHRPQGSDAGQSGK